MVEAKNNNKTRKAVRPALIETSNVQGNVRQPWANQPLKRRFIQVALACRLSLLGRIDERRLGETCVRSYHIYGQDVWNPTDGELVHNLRNRLIIMKIAMQWNSRKAIL